MRQIYIYIYYKRNSLRRKINNYIIIIILIYDCKKHLEEETNDNKK